MTTSPQGPENAPRPHPHAADATAPHATVPPATPTGTGTLTTPAPAAPPRQRRRFGDIAVASVLAAALASGGTYVAVRAADDGSTVSAGSTSDTASGTTTQGTTVALTGEKDWRAIATEVTPSVVSIDTAGAQGTGAGSGVVWDGEGHVVTNAHVVEGAQALRVVLSDGRAYPATVVGTDVSSDLAVVKLETVPDGLTPIRVGDDEALAVGDPVMAVGNPLGLSGTVTTGIVSALDRPVSTQGGSSRLGQAGPVVTNAIQTSAAINPGNSGGALLNGAGELVGINSSIAALPSAGQSQAGSIGIGFAIPAAKVRLIADQLIETGTAQHAFLGVALGDGEAQTDGATLSGAEVGQVEPNSPAEQAGLKAGDLIIGIDGESVTSATALVGQVRERGTGEEVTIDYVRQGQREKVTVTLATRPDQG